MINSTRDFDCHNAGGLNISKSRGVEATLPRPAPCSPRPALQHLLHRAVPSKPPTPSSLLQKHLETPFLLSSTLSLRQGGHPQGHPRPASGCAAPWCCHCSAGAQEPTWQLSQSAISQLPVLRRGLEHHHRQPGHDPSWDPHNGARTTPPQHLPH